MQLIGNSSMNVFVKYTGGRQALGCLQVTQMVDVATISSTKIGHLIK